MQGRWSHGGYRIVFLTQTRSPVVAEPPTDGLVKRMLATGFQAAVDGPTQEIDLTSSLGMGGWELPGMAWGPVDGTTAAWLDGTLTRPWHQCVRDVVNGEPWSTAAVIAMVGNDHLGAWGDHGAALAVTIAATVVVIQVGLWTD